MRYRNFVISAMGRSGTSFLAELMNRSNTWTVRHEPRFSERYIAFGEITGWKPPNLKRLQRRFNRDYYGEVNSYLRHVLQHLDVAHKGVIIRNPRAIALSMYNRKRHLVEAGKVTWEALGIHLYAALRSLDREIEAGVRCIRFERMVSDRAFLAETLQYFGIDDYEPTDSDVQRVVNPNRVIYCRTFSEVDDGFKAVITRGSDWFMAKYYPNEALTSQ